MSSTIEKAPTLSISGWSWLPSHIFDSILEKLIPISDHIRFSAVCKHWQSAVLHQKQQHLKSHQKQLPMLMIPSKHSINERRGLYCVSQGKPYSFEFRVPNNMRCCGSSYGWLTCVDRADSSAVTLLNPFTGCTISLPPVHLFKQRFDDSVHKVVLSADPGLFPNDYEVLVIFNLSGDELAHFRSGEDAWTTRICNRIRFSNLIYHKGQFLAVSFDNEVFSVKIFRDSYTKLHIDLVLDQVPGFGRPYLAESSVGDLLMISKLQIADHVSYKVSVYFKVFKLQCACGERPGCAEEIESLGNDALFLGDNESLSVSTLDFPGCQPNSIYFSTDGWAPPPKDYTRGPLTKAAFKFNMENATMDELYYCDPPSQINLPSIWILPTMV